jgi:hypothetical protein
MKKLLPCLLGTAALIVSLTPSSASAGVRVGIGGWGWGGWGWGPGFGTTIPTGATITAGTIRAAIGLLPGAALRLSQLASPLVTPRHD